MLMGLYRGENGAPEEALDFLAEGKHEDRLA